MAITPFITKHVSTIEHSKSTIIKMLVNHRIALDGLLTKLAAKTMSRLISCSASSIFLYKLVSPTIRAALITSRVVSSKRLIQRTMEPSRTSVKSVICLKGYKAV